VTVRGIEAPKKVSQEINISTRREKGQEKRKQHHFAHIQPAFVSEELLSSV
jgi:hypothetical protein